MPIVNCYLAVAELKAVLGDTGGTTHEAGYERAIEAASRQIDEFCRRRFWQDAAVSAREFFPLTPHAVLTDDIATTTGLVVEAYAGSGTWSAMLATQWAVDPVTPFNGRPINRLVSYDGAFATGTRPQVRVTARWGWPAVPAQVKQACQILAVDHFKSKDMTGGVAGFGDAGPVRVAAFNPQARNLLEMVQLAGVP